MATQDSESFSVGGKVSKGLMAILGVVVGVGGTAGVLGARTPTPEHQTIGAVTSAAESRAQSVALAEGAKLRNDVQSDLSRHRGELAEVIKQMAATQEKQAESLSVVRSTLARIEGRLEAQAAAPRRR